MKMFRNLYTKAQEMSAEKVLDTKQYHNCIIY